MPKEGRRESMLVNCCTSWSVSSSMRMSIACFDLEEDDASWSSWPPPLDGFILFWLAEDDAIVMQVYWGFEIYLVDLLVITVGLHDKYAGTNSIWSLQRLLYRTGFSVFCR